MLLPRERHTLGMSLTNDRMAYLVDVEYGGGLLPTLINESDRIYRLAGARLEVRRELGTPDPLFRQRRWHYLGLRVGYRHFERELFDRDFVSVSDLKLTFDRAVQDFHRTEAILTYTLSLPVSDRIWLEGFGGLGAAVRTVSYRDVVNLRETDLLKELIVTIIVPGGALLDDSPAEGTRIVPALRLGFRASYLLSPAR